MLNTMSKATPFLRLLSFLSVLAISQLAGCATVEGAGKDIQSAGEAVEDAAEDASN